MSVEKSDIEKLVGLIIEQLNYDKSMSNNIKIDFSANGDIIIDVIEDEVDSDGIIKGDPLPDKVVRKHTKMAEDDDEIEQAIEKAITIWSMEMKTKFGDVKWNSKM